MRRFRGNISTNVSGSNCKFEFDVPDDATSEEIEKEAKDEAFNCVDWEYHEIS